MIQAFAASKEVRRFLDQFKFTQQRMRKDPNLKIGIEIKKAIETLIGKAGVMDPRNLVESLSVKFPNFGTQ